MQVRLIFLDCVAMAPEQKAEFLSEHRENKICH